METYYNYEDSNYIDDHEVVQKFKQYYYEKEDEMHIAAIKAISDTIQTEEAETCFELFVNLKDSKDTLINFTKKSSARNEIISQAHSKRMTIFTIVSCAEIYHHFFVKNYVHHENQCNELQESLIKSAFSFPEKIQKSLKIIGESSNLMFPQDEMTILTHSNSESVKAVLLNVCKKKKVNVFFTSFEHVSRDLEWKDKRFDDEFLDFLHKHNINVTKISLKKAEQMFHKFDFVICGTELVIDNGGIISKRGVRMLSKLCVLNKKPFYVVCEAFKFLKIDKIKYADDFYRYCTQKSYNEKDTLYEFVPNDSITLFFTDIGIFTPLIISYELNKLYVNDVFRF